MANAKSWTADDMPDLSGQTVIVTGSNSGIGYEAALQFARKKANTILACRSLEKAGAAAKQIVASNPGAAVEVMELDLSSLASIRSFAEAFHKSQRNLRALVNNAGVMALPHRKTVDGFEMQFGTNHLGHFALTGLLLDALLATDDARVVNVRAVVIGSGASASTIFNGSAVTTNGSHTDRASWRTCSSPSNCSAAPMRPAPSCSPSYVILVTRRRTCRAPVRGCKVQRAWNHFGGR